jgi:hypothetical protein
MIATDHLANAPFKKGLRAGGVKFCQGCDSHVLVVTLTSEHVDLESVGPGDS